MARTQAIRLFSELAASPDMQGLLVSSGAAAALAAHGSFLVSCQWLFQVCSVLCCNAHWHAWQDHFAGIQVQSVCVSGQEIIHHCDRLCSDHEHVHANCFCIRNLGRHYPIVCDAGLQQAHESMKEDKTYSSMAAVPGNMAELLEVEEERFAAAALFGMAGSDACIKVILQTDDASAVDGKTITGRLSAGQRLFACLVIAAIHTAYADWKNSSCTCADEHLRATESPECQQSWLESCRHDKVDKVQ